MDTKLVGDISVQMTVLLALKRGWGVSLPVGDRLPYDLILDVDSRLLRVQVKTAWKSRAGWVVSVRRCKTNRREYKFERYKEGDFDLAVVWIKDEPIFYVLPAPLFMSYSSGISFEFRAPKKSNKILRYRNNWSALSSLLVP